MFTKGQRDRSYAVLQAGGARYSVTQSGKCAAVIASLMNNNATEISNAIKIYPQPANNYANIGFKTNWKGNTTITLINGMGSIVTVKQTNAESKIYRLDVSALKSGIYYIRLNNNKEMISQKIIVQH